MKTPWNWKQISVPPGTFEHVEARFEAGFYEVALEARPDDLELLLALGSAYSRLGDPQKSLEVDLRLVDARPDEPIFRQVRATHHGRSPKYAHGRSSLLQAHVILPAHRTHRPARGQRLPLG